MRPSALSGRPDSVIWHEVECGAYEADLALWGRLAAEAAGPLLELGCGSGRVALHLARAGYDVTGLDRDAELVCELRRRAAAEGVEVEAIEDGACDFDLGRRFALVLAPMQLVHLLAGEAERRMLLGRASRHLAPAGTLAVALLADGPVAVDGDTRPPPDVREIDGWVYSSLPLEVREIDGSIEVRRLRQTVSPAGELSERLDLTRLGSIDADGLAAEAASANLRERERLEIPPTAEHVGSTVLVLERRGSR